MVLSKHGENTIADKQKYVKHLAERVLMTVSRLEHTTKNCDQAVTAIIENSRLLLSGKFTSKAKQTNQNLNRKHFHDLV
jgi:hypothetical protein